MAPQLVALAGCGGSANTVTETSGGYDAIIVGGGTAGTIVAAKLQAASGGRKRILIIEAGGATSATIGGTDFPSWGPAGWHSADMAPYFQRVRDNIPVTNTPSTDGVAQNTGPADIIHPLYAANGWVEGNTSMPIAGPGGLYSRPYVAAVNGRRAGPISGYFEAVDPGGVPMPGLEILQFAKCNGIDFDAKGNAVAVNYLRRPSLDQSQPGVERAAFLKAGGIVVMAAGALITPQILLLSGVGPRGREGEIFPGRSKVPRFSINNPLVGVGVFDHVMSLVTYGYDGPVPYQAYDYGDFAGNAADLANYLANGSGPYAQYQPVSILHFGLGRTTPNVEVFINPNGAGTPGGPYYGPRTFSTYIMLLDPQARGLITLNDKDQVNVPAIYLPDTPDGNADTTLMTQAVFNIIQLYAQNPNLKIVFGPGSASHPHLDPNNLADIHTYVTAPQPVDGVFYNRFIINHFGGTVALSNGPGGVDPQTLIVRGTTNVAVVDASVIPTIVVGHPVGTIMAIADRAGDILASRWI